MTDSLRIISRPSLLLLTVLQALADTWGPQLGLLSFSANEDAVNFSGLSDATARPRFVENDAIVADALEALTL
jgi:hypothetical protein